MKRLDLISLFLLGALACRATDKPPVTHPGQATARTDGDASTRRASELQAKLDAFDERLEAKREELGIPGLALVIVKDDRVLYLAGHGLRDIERQLPVDADTLFAIGSTTKAFTAMLVLMAREAGVLSLDDSPKKCLPYFSLEDENADRNIKVRDLLTHTSGLARMDIGWITGKLSKEEIIRLAGLAKPVADLGKEFHYQNIMYLAAGECVATVMRSSYEALLQERIFDVISMRSANVSVAETQALPTHAVGYAQFGVDKKIRPVPMRPLDNIAPAGAINASARDMGQWLRLLLGRGTVDGKRLISEASFEEMIKPYIEVGAGTSYGLGWVLQELHGRHIMTHGGGIDGFVTLVTLVPDMNLGFALFTNIQNGDIHGYVTNEVLQLFTSGANSSQAENRSTDMDDPASEVGTYGILGGMRVQVTWKDGVLTLHVPNQPAYPLERVDRRRYRLGAPAPAGFFATFRDSQKLVEGIQAEAELVIEQPGITVVLARLTPEILQAASRAEAPAGLRPLIGTYRMKDGLLEIQLEAREGRVAVVVPGQAPMPLVPAGTDRYLLDGLPDSFFVTVTRAADGALTGLTLVQPNARLEFSRVAGQEAPTITVAELARRVAKAHGSTTLARKRTLLTEARMDIVNQGLSARHVTMRQAPDRVAEIVTLLAFGKEIGTIHTGTDGTRAWQRIDFLPTDEPRGAALTGMQLHGVFNPYAGWQERYAKVEVTGTSRVRDTPTIVLELTHESGLEITEHYAADSYLLLQRTTLIPGEEGGPSVNTEIFLDYRNVGGIMFAHRIEAEGSLGKTITTIAKVAWDATLPKDAFQPR